MMMAARRVAKLAGGVCAAVLMLLAADLSAAWANPLESVVAVRASVPSDARTAETLGTEREGSGVVIDDDGHVLTIGYLIMESSQAEIELPGGRTLPAEVVAYDYDSGFGLLRPLGQIDAMPVAFGESDGLDEQSPVLVASFGGANAATAAIVVSRRDFAGYWEYLLPNAIFTSPPHMAFGGAALFGPTGQLLGIGSLIVGDAGGGESRLPGNMFVPIDALKPILADLLAEGHAQTPARPWLGIFTQELLGHLVVNRVAPEGPAATAGVKANDVIVAVAGAPIADQADFYRKVWALGEAGVAVPLSLLTSQGVTEITVTSGDRYNYLRLNPTY